MDTNPTPILEQDRSGSFTLTAEFVGWEFCGRPESLDTPIIPSLSLHPLDCPPAYSSHGDGHLYIAAL
jgi:hypothetical protein